MTQVAIAKETESLLGRSKPEGHVREQLSGRHGEPALARLPLFEGPEKPSSFQYVRTAKLARLHLSCRGNVEEKAYRLIPARQRERFGR